MNLDLSHYLLAALALPAGIGAGWLHFRTLRLLAGRIVTGDMAAIGLQLLRLLLLAGFLMLCALGGALVLLSASLGLFLGRAWVLRRERRATT